eukprot:5787394-Pleurochrysis_carterae.AAC.1
MPTKIQEDVNGTMVEKDVEVIGTSLRGEFNVKVTRPHTHRPPSACIAASDASVGCVGSFAPKRPRCYDHPPPVGFLLQALKELYRQYLIEAFSGQNSAQNARLFNNLNRLAL